mgnify:CR=1 FL=1
MTSLEKISKRKGLIGTIMFHTLLVVAFMFMGLTYQEPPPAEEGISINFGFLNEGLSEIDRFCDTLIKIKQEIEKIKSGEFDKIDNPIKNAPHTDTELSSDVWEHKYSRQEAAYPASFLKQNKFWPPVARVDNVYGDKNIFCTCPSMDEFKEDAA